MEQLESGVLFGAKFTPETWEAARQWVQDRAQQAEIVATTTRLYLPVGLSSMVTVDENDASAAIATAEAAKKAATPTKPKTIAKQTKPTTDEGSSDGSSSDDVKVEEVIEVKRHATQDEIADPEVAVDPAGQITEQVKPQRATRTKKDTLKSIEDFSKLPVAVHVGQVAASVEEYSGRAVLSISLVGWVGEAPFKILADDIDELEDALANLRKQLS